MGQLKRFILSILNYIRHKKSYSQDGEDVALLGFYEGVKHYKGFYVDIGAHHPVRFSNTHLFYKLGWRGINIDPTPGSMKAFRFWRLRDINLEIGIGAQNDTLKFFCFNDPALNTFDAQVAQQRNTGKPYKVIREVEIPIRPLIDVLIEHLPKGQVIDFISIDVEGLDLEVLQSNDWQKWSPKFVLVEDHEFQIEQLEKSKIYVFLKSQGYRISAVLKRTIIYQKIVN
ncbi:MAG: FkbM family methyltransferase [Lewinellaceae bacterium]|nr:FkbM family methyltransferase [Lewinellaceae bacterium]